VGTVSPPKQTLSVLLFGENLGLSAVPVVTASLPAAVRHCVVGGLFCLETLWSRAEEFGARDLGVKPPVSSSIPVGHFWA
jgi:hypothetical protein